MECNHPYSYLHFFPPFLATALASSELTACFCFCYLQSSSMNKSVVDFSLLIFWTPIGVYQTLFYTKSRCILLFSCVTSIVCMEMRDLVMEMPISKSGVGMKRQNGYYMIIPCHFKCLGHGHPWQVFHRSSYDPQARWRLEVKSRWLRILPHRG